MPGPNSKPQSSFSRAWRRWPLSLKVAAVCSAWLFIWTLALGVISSSAAAVVTLLGIPAGIAVCALLVYRGYHYSTIGVIALAMFAYASYVGYTSHAERNFDVEHQVKYIMYLVQHHSAPPSDHCFICHHPPLYYASSAVVYGLTAALGLSNPLRAVQIFSLLCVLSFAICNAATLRQCTKNPWIVSVGTALASLWPYTIIHSARVHNDVLATALMSWTIYACLRFYRKPSRNWLLGAALLAGLSVLTKTNGYVVVALVFVTVFARWLWPVQEPGARRKLLRYALPTCVVMALVLGSFARSRGGQRSQESKTEPDKVAAQAPDNDAPEMTERLLGSAAKIGQRAWMHNEPYNYMYFDLREFLEQPYIMAHVDNVGRQLYFNHMLKSSLFSTHNEHPDAETSYRINRRLASILNYLLLLLCAFVFYFALSAKKEGVRRNFPLIAAFFGFLAGGIAFRALVPHTHHSDFRHIFPILLPFCAAFALGVERYSKRKSFMATLGLGLAASFLGITLLYLAPKYRWIQANSPVKWTEVYSGAVSRWVKAGTTWNQKGNTLLEGTDGLRVKFSHKPTVENFAVSLDNNDKYQITIVGAQESRTVEVGPHPDKKAGMAEYLQQVSPPIKQVKEVLVRPLLGDHAYSVGHLVVNHQVKAATSPVKPLAPAAKPAPAGKPAPAVGPQKPGAAVPKSKAGVAPKAAPEGNNKGPARGKKRGTPAKPGKKSGRNKKKAERAARAKRRRRERAKRMAERRKRRKQREKANAR